MVAVVKFYRAAALQLTSATAVETGWSTEDFPCRFPEFQDSSQKIPGHFCGMRQQKIWEILESDKIIMLLNRRNFRNHKRQNYIFIYSGTENSLTFP